MAKSKNGYALTDAGVQLGVYETRKAAEAEAAEGNLHPSRAEIQNLDRPGCYRQRRDNRGRLRWRKHHG